MERITKRTAFGILKELKKLWNDSLLPYLRSHELTAGKGIRIQKLPAGIVISATGAGSVGGAVGSDGASGNFIVSFDAENVMLKVGAGFINCNGFCKKFEGGTIAPEKGTLCLTAEKDGTDWKHALKFGDFADDMFPLAEISIEDTEVSIRQYPVNVAQFVITKVCPLTKAGESE